MGIEELFLTWGGFSVWLFIVATPPQIWRNYKQKKYTSGSRWTWILFIVAHILFGLYMFMVGDIIVLSGQIMGLIFCASIMTQSFIYDHAS